jgi:hypothetical protein
MSTTNTSDYDEYPDLAEDPDLAFRELEKKFRREMTEALNNLDERDSGNLCYLSYINRTVAAAKIFGIEIFKE